MTSRRILAPVAALGFTVLATHATTNPEGYSTTDCQTCAAPDGTGTGATSSHSSSFEWSINTGLARYPKPASYTGIGSLAYERNGHLPTFKELVGRYFPGAALQQSQVPLRINQTKISAETFHPACLMLDSEALFERITKSDSGGEYVYQVVTSDAFTQVDLIAGGATPDGIGSAVGAGWQVRVWRKPTGFTKSGTYYTAPSDTPLTNAVICRPNISSPGDNTLLFILKETTGIASQGSGISTTVVVQTLDGSGRPATVTSRVYGVVVTNPASASSPVSEETLTYSAHGSKKWDYTINRVNKAASVSGGTAGALITTSESTEVYEDFSANASEGGEPGMKRLMSRTSNGRTTTYDYYREPTVPYAHGRPKSEVNTDGSWKAWEYIFGTMPVFTEYSSWLDRPITEKANARKVVTTVNGGEFTTETTIAGQLISKSKTNRSGQIVTESQWDATASNWLDTVTTYYADSDSTIAAGRVSSVVRPDGTRTTYTYSGGATDQVVTEVADSATAAAGSSGSPDALKTITHYNSGNIAISREVYIVSPGVADREIPTESWSMDTTITESIDALGRPVQRNFVDGTKEVTRYACCGLQYHKSRDGTETEYFRDALKRVYKVTVDPPGDAPLVATVTDIASSAWTSVIPSGVTTTRSQTVGGSTVFLGSSTTSTDGQATLSVEPSRKSTSSDDRLHTLTQIWNNGLETAVHHKRQGDSTWIWDSSSDLYPDGRTSDVTLSGDGGTTHYDYYPHSENGGGLVSYTYSWGYVNGSYFHQSYTYTDSLGRTFRTITPAAGQTDYEFCSSADPAGSMGRLKTETDADGVTTTYGYNVRGEQATTTRVVPVGTSYTSTNLVSTTTTSTEDDVIIHSQNIGTCRKSSQTIGGFTTTTYHSLDGLKSATVSPSGNTLSVTTRASSSNSWTETVLTTGPDGSMTKTTTTPSTGGRTITTARFAKGVDPSSGTPVSSTAKAYDNFDRLTSATDSRTDAVTYASFTESGQPTSVTDAGSRTTTYEYDVVLPMHL